MQLDSKNKRVEFEGVYLTFSNYKEPLKALTKREGFGFHGVLLGTVDGDKLQCHLCGKLFKSLCFHISQKHKIGVKDYREKFQLSKKTALISENQRERLKLQTLKWLAKLTDEEREQFKKHQTERLRKWHIAKGKKYISKLSSYKPSLEQKNKRGICPDQIIKKILDARDHYGRTPSKHEFIDFCESQSYYHLIKPTFGGWDKALKAAKLTKKTRTYSSVGTGSYSDEELLEYLNIFWRENNKIPTETDCRRGLIPDSAVYRKRWGSFPNARIQAGIEGEVGNHIRIRKKLA